MAERLCVVMPVYNEEEAIGGVLKKWSDALTSLGIDFTIRPYNDGSKDSSLKVMHDFVAAHPNSHIEVRDKMNGGHGHTILTGYREAAEDGFDWVFQIDSDDEMGPEKFGELWSHRSDYDFLVGIRDGRVQALPRKVISFVSRCCVKLFYGRKTVWDVNTPYRLMRVSAFASIYTQIPLTTFAPNVIISGIVARKHLRYFQMQVPQHDRTTGVVSIKKWKLLKAAMRSFIQTIKFSITTEEKRCCLLLLVMSILVVSLMAKSPAFHCPTSDTQVFEHIGRLVSDGATLYKEVFDHKGPAFLLLNVLGWLITGNEWGIWILHAILLSITSISLYFCVAKRTSVVFAFMSATLLIVLPLEYNYPDTFCAYLSIIAFFIAYFNKSSLSIFLCGIIASLAFLSKQCCISYFIAYGLFLLLQHPEDNQQHKKMLFLYVIGGIIGLATSLLILFSMGLLDGYLDCCWRFNLIYAKISNRSIVTIIFKLLKIFQDNFLFVVVGIISFLTMPNTFPRHWKKNYYRVGFCVYNRVLSINNWTWAMGISVCWASFTFVYAIHHVGFV